jgi:hypothetical protein
MDLALARRVVRRNPRRSAARTGHSRLARRDPYFSAGTASALSITCLAGRMRSCRVETSSRKKCQTHQRTDVTDRGAVGCRGCVSRLAPPGTSGLDAASSPHLDRPGNRRSRSVRIRRQSRGRPRPGAASNPTAPSPTLYSDDAISHQRSHQAAVLRHPTRCRPRRSI